MKTFIFAAVALASLALTNVCSAERYNAVVNGKDVVVHTRVAPVVVHRVLPPYGLGKHVYEGRTR